MSRISTGSDCLTGKTQYATKKIATEAACSLRHNKQRSRTARAYRCSWCELWHIGNKGRADTSKGRGRR